MVVVADGCCASRSGFWCLVPRGGRWPGTGCQYVVHRRCYHGFHVLRDSGVPRVPANGATVDCEQLRQDDQHVLEHHQFHVSARARVMIHRAVSHGEVTRDGDSGEDSIT